VITVIISTNRTNSATSKVAATVAELIEKQGEETHVLDLSKLPADFFAPTMYEHRSPEFMQLFHEYIEAARHIVFVIPEYNGSYPGVLKLFIDGSPVRSFWNKHASMIGLSDGQAGNMRGQDHLTGVLHYMKMHVHYHKPKLSGISKALDADGKLIHEQYNKQLEEHAALIVG
jgi:NAD(P)H-dependent FMN reductase